MTDTIGVRAMTANDADDVLAFARALPPHDLLFLQRDIRNAKVMAAWIDQLGSGEIMTLLATDDDETVIGCAAVVRDPFSWSPHVAELRIVVAEAARGAGVGRRLAEHAFAMAVETGAEKLSVRIVPDQEGAIALFEEMGFRAEAMLRDQVRDADGSTHDLAILSLDVRRAGGQHAAYGLG